VFDFNGPAWRAIRADLEPSRRLAGELFHQPVFDEVVPPPEAKWAGGDAIVSTSAPKLLLAALALLRWLGRGAPMGDG
ncbi:MAG TPA: hypothetical protein VI383_03460, partial [Gemmatimonadales bacterium]|nr:hypothetical protein [Gemmatimonadales bacterium]